MASNTSVVYEIGLKDFFSQGIKNATAATENLNAKVNQLQSVLANVGIAFGGGMIVNEIYKAGTAMDTLSISLETMLGNKAESDKLLADMIQLAKTTPFQQDEVATAGKQLLAFGIEAKDVIKDLRMLGDVSAGLGQPVGEIAYLFGTIRTQQKAMTVDIRQFANRGIPIYEELTKITGLSGIALQKFIEDGQVGFPLIEQAFANLSGEGGKFNNLMAKISLTTGGQMSNLKDQLIAVAVEAFGVLRPAIDLTIKSLSIFVDILKGGINFIKDHSIAIGMAATAMLTYYTYTKLATIWTGTKLVYALISMTAAMEGVTVAQYALNLATAIFDGLTGNVWALGLAAIAAVTYGIYKATDAQKELNGEMKKGGLKGVINPMSAKMPSSSSVNTASTKGGTSTTAVESKGVQNFNIDIGKLVEKIEINTQNLKEGASQIKEQVAQALIEAVNDFQLMATK